MMHDTTLQRFMQRVRSLIERFAEMVWALLLMDILQTGMALEGRVGQRVLQRALAHFRGCSVSIT
jgi:hypothetical protein